MANLPNIELTKDELSYFMNERTNLLGAEGKVFTGIHQGEARKIFYYPFNGTTRELEEFYNEMDNKRKKLIALSEKKLNNDIVPIATLSYDDRLLSMPARKTLPYSCRTANTTTEHLCSCTATVRRSFPSLKGMN